jgi:hypothetical protein
MGRRWLVGAALVCLTAGCTGSEQGTPFTGLSDRGVTADRDNRQQAELAVLSGATAVVVRSADLGGQLFRAWTPEGSRLAPQANVDGDVVRLSFGEGHGNGPAEIHVDLAADVAWKVRLDGGAAEQTVDLRTATVKAVDFGAGAQRINVTLPAPVGIVPIRMTGGASVFDLHLPVGTEAEVRFTGGAGQAVIDGAASAGLAGGTVLHTANFHTTADHYAVDAVAGVASLSLDRT